MNQASAEYRSEVLSLETVCSENVKHHSYTSSPLFITCNLFSDAASVPDCVLSNDMMSSDLTNWKDAEGSAHGLI
jgi:hypothetical protein